MGHQTRIMYIECKAGELTGAARIGRMTFSKTGATLRYREQEFQSLKGSGFKGKLLRGGKREMNTGSLAHAKTVQMLCIPQTFLQLSTMTFGRNTGRRFDKCRNHKGVRND